MGVFNLSYAPFCRTLYKGEDSALERRMVSIAERNTRPNIDLSHNAKGVMFANTGVPRFCLQPRAALSPYPTCLRYTWPRRSFLCVPHSQSADAKKE